MNGNVTYQATLPPGWVQPGAYQISSNGGPDIGAFQIPLKVGSEIRVTSQFPQGMIVRTPGPADSFTVFWTGGQPGEVVTLKVVAHEFIYDRIQTAQAPATSGMVSIRLPLISGSNIEIDVEAGPDPTQTQMVTASGLTLGAQAQWVYEYRFVGLFEQ